MLQVEAAELIAGDNTVYLLNWSAVIDQMHLQVLDYEALRLAVPVHPFSDQDRDVLNPAIHLSHLVFAPSTLLVLVSLSMSRRLMQIDESLTPL